jgi:hypothetical protein
MANQRDPVIDELIERQYTPDIVVDGCPGYNCKNGILFVRSCMSLNPRRIFMYLHSHNHVPTTWHEIVSIMRQIYNFDNLYGTNDMNYLINYLDNEMLPFDGPTKGVQVG